MSSNTAKFINIWLNTAIIFILLMVLIGGLTRLTESGLSITEWQIISGILPPFNHAGWQELFLKYQKIPEFTINNPDMNLSEFKQIFWLEYFHRLIGRLTGLFIIIPAIYLIYKRAIPNYKLLLSVIIITPMQGLIGWLMVKSGLTDRVDVSHFRLAIHLSVALIIYLVFIELKLKQDSAQKLQPLKINIWLIIFTLIFLQIIFGAFVAGLKAGYIYNTYPMMGNGFIPSDLVFYESIFTNILQHPTMVQFIHRKLAIAILLIIIVLFLTQYSRLKENHQLHYLIYLLICILIQFLLGISTLLTVVNIYLASLHQMAAVALLTASYLSYRRIGK